MSENTDLQQQLDDLKAGNDALDKKNRELLGELKAAKARAKGAEIDPEEHAALQHQLEETQTELSKLTKATAKEIEKLQTEVANKDGSLRSHLLDSGLSDAMLKANVRPEVVPAVKALLKERTQLQENEGSYAALMGDKPLAEGVLEWAQSDEGKFFVAAPDSSGGGAAGGEEGGSGTPPKGDLGGDRADRVSALKARYPELSKQG